MFTILNKIKFYRNKIMDLTRLHFLNFCEQLKSLSLSGCPVAKVENFEKNVRSILPNLNHFNGNQTLGKKSCILYLI